MSDKKIKKDLELYFMVNHKSYQSTHKYESRIITLYELSR